MAALFSKKKGGNGVTADALFDYVLALMFSDANEKTELTTQFLATLNIHLAELLDRENGYRKIPLEAPPIITNLTDVLDYNRRLLALLPYGIAGTMLAEDEPNIALQYKNKYEDMKSRCVVCRFVEVG